MVEAIRSYCLDNEVQVGDVPAFVNQVLNTPIPFSKSAGKLVKNPKFNYVEELEPAHKKSVDDLPGKIKKNLYQF